MSLDTDKLMERRRQRRQALLWKVVAAIMATSLVAVVVMKSGELSFGGESASELFDGDHIARIYVDGVIVEDRHRDALLQKLKDEDRVKAVVVKINSPGGTVVGGENLYLGLRAISAVKPVVAVMGSTATSAAYMTAIGTDQIFARSGTITGSVGVIMQTADMSGLMDKIGVKPETIKSGKLKAQPNPLEPMSDDARAHVEDVVMEMYDLFVDMVAERRKMGTQAIKKIADGRVFIGKSALEVGLIDAIGGEAEAIEWLETKHNLETDLPVKDKKPDYPRPDAVERLLGGLGKALVSERLKLDGLLSVWHPNQ